MMKKVLTIILSLCVIIPLSFGQSKGFLNRIDDYIENLEVFSVGEEPPRSFHIPDAHMSLNGNWKFRYSETPVDIPGTFFRSEFDDIPWSTIKVPANWEMEGFGDPLFRNISTTWSLQRPVDAPSARSGRSDDKSKSSQFAVTPPEVPDEYNPTGAYRTNFTLPPDWQDQQVFLRFEKIASASFVWVNGREVGYHEGAHEPSEYNITRYLLPGTNTIAVLVLKFSDGYYLEGQDYWRLAGIFGDVWLYATPSVRLYDWQVITDLDETYADAQLTVNIDVRRYDSQDQPCRVTGKLDHNGQTIVEMNSPSFIISSKQQTITLQANVKDPAKWTSETPELYDMSLQLWDEENRLVDQIHTHMGFKETEIIGNTFYLNGVPIKVNAMNSHMQHPLMGHAMDEATIRRDFTLLKQFNFNAVRTSHYPPVNQYLELANEYGLFIIDETGVEAHATEYVSDMTAYTAMYRDRVQRMVLRDRNYPCVLFWSAGNESGEGSNITEVIREGKRLDPTRYWMYGGNADIHPAEDIVGPRYPTPLELEIYFGMDSSDQRPSFMDEYLAVTGNGGGGMDEYWESIYAHPRLMGGAIWDFVSPGLQEPVRQLRDRSPYGTPVHLMGRAQRVEDGYNKVLDLNGHDQWVEIYRANQLDIQVNALTIALDIYPRRLMRDGAPILTKGSHQFGLVQVGMDSLEFYLYTQEKQSLKVALPSNWEHHWHQLVAVYDGTSMQLFIDNRLAGSQAVTGHISNFPYPVNIGRDVEAHGQDTDEYLCDARIDEIRIFDKVMDDPETWRPEEALLWLDCEEEISEDSFYSYGIGARTYGAIWPDRKPQPEMWQMKKSGQPLHITPVNLEQGVMEVCNRSNFTTASQWQTNWVITADMDTLQSGVLSLEVPARSKKLIKIPFAKPQIHQGKVYRLLISTILKQDERWAPAGFEIAWDQFEFSTWEIPSSPALTRAGAVELVEDNDMYAIQGEGFTYTIDKTDGQLSSIRVDEHEWLIDPVQFNVWRAPLANELDSWNGGTFRSPRWQDGLGTTLATDYYSNGIHELNNMHIEIDTHASDELVVVEIRQLILTHGGKKHYTIGDRYRRGASLNGFANTWRYTFFGDGTIHLQHRILPQGSMPQMLPRIGLSMMLDTSLHQVTWHGRGPQENYPDRKSGYRQGIFSATVGDLYEPYLIPQDHGLRTDNRWLRLTNAESKGLEFSMSTPFNFNIYPYTTDNLTRALYPFQLSQADGRTLNLDYRTTGVGGTARMVFEGYRTYPQEYKREVWIKIIR